MPCCQFGWIQWYLWVVNGYAPLFVMAVIVTYCHFFCPLRKMTHPNLLCDSGSYPGILVLTFNIPEKRNALDLQILAALENALAESSENPQVKGIILTGMGEQAFMAGADIAEFAAVDASNAREFSERGQRVLACLQDYPKPIIAAVNGFALGGGCEIAMACHIRIAAGNARFGQPEVKLGIIPGYGGTQRLLQLVGKGKALELLLTGDHISAQEALQLGLVNYVVSQLELLPVCNQLLQKIITNAPVAISMVIKSVNAYFAGADYVTEAENFVKCCQTSDFREGTNAFISKRQAHFTGN